MLVVGRQVHAKEEKSTVQEREDENVEELRERISVRLSAKHVLEAAFAA